MKLLLSFLGLLSVLLAAGCAPAPAQPSASPAPSPTPTAGPTPSGTADPALLAVIPLAEEFVSQLAQGRFEEATARFDATMKTAAPAPKLKEIWEQLQGQLGAFKRQTGTHSTQAQANRIIFVTCEFEKGAVDLQVPFNPQGQIIGFFIRPAGTGQTPAYTAPAYVNKASFHEVQVTVGAGGDWPLPGTLTLPNGPGPFPAVVLVHGSGPNDRDESIGPNLPFRDLAWGLASQGVAVLRYDKRTLVFGKQFSAEQLQNITVTEEVTADAVLAVQLLGETQGIDSKRIYLAGHSLGAMLAPRLGALAPSLAGLVMLAAPARPLEDLVVEQTAYLAGLSGKAEDQAGLNTVQTQAARVKDPALSPAASSADLPLGIPAPYWLDLRSYNQVETAGSLSLPILILQGGRDYQVSAEKDFGAWQAALSGRKTVTFKLYPALNHLFISGTGPANPAEYNSAGHVSEEVIKDIGSWILK